MDAPAATDCPEQADAGRRLFAGAATFLRGVASLDQLPPPELPEIAFAGRSNVGKSSLLNALTGRSGLARTSNTPGRTQELNFFDLAGRLCLVDLPGYGYARAPKAEAARWQKLVLDYLRGRPTLARACLLVDARHGLKPIDEEVMATLGKAAVPFAVVLTKADLIGTPEREALLGETRARLRARQGAVPDPLLTSARKHEGLDKLRTTLEALARPSAADSAA